VTLELVFKTAGPRRSRGDFSGSSRRRPEDQAGLTMRHHFFSLHPLCKSEVALCSRTGQKAKARPREPRLAIRRRRVEKLLGRAWICLARLGLGIWIVLNKAAAVCVFSEMGRGGKRRMPLARAAKPLKRLKTAMGSSWKKLAWIWVWRHSRLGLAPLPLGFAMGRGPTGGP
jgi:hypothetical protein